MIVNEISVIHFLKTYYTLNDVLEVEFKFNKSVEEFNFIKFQIAKIDAQSDYNNIISTLTTDLKVDEFGKYKIMLKCDILEEGLFFFCYFELLKQEKWDAEFPMKFDIYETENIKQQYFKIGDQGNELDYSSIIQEIKNIHAIREKKFTLKLVSSR